MAPSIAKLCIVVDKMHMTGHVDRLCKEYCDTRKRDEISPDNLYISHSTVVLCI